MRCAHSWDYETHFEWDTKTQTLSLKEMTLSPVTRVEQILCGQEIDKHKLSLGMVVLRILMVDFLWNVLALRYWKRRGHQVACSSGGGVGTAVTSIG